MERKYYERKKNSVNEGNIFENRGGNTVFEGGNPMNGVGNTIDGGGKNYKRRNK